MKKVESDFKNKFHLLYSQESSETIIWSTSDSSDYENHTENIENRKYTPNSRKRKRRCSRNKLRNISNLDVVYAEDKQKIQLTINTRKSPIMKIKSTPCTSPIVSKAQRRATKDLPKSPIVSIPQEFKLHKSVKSPILMSKTISPTKSPNVRKKLFVCKETPLLCKVKEVVCDKSIPQNTKETSTVTQSTILTHIKSESNLSSKSLANTSHVQNNKPSNETVAGESADLVKRVHTYFENHFNSQASSQNSISEYESTPRTYTKTSDEIDIISLTDDNEKSNSDMMSSKDSSLDLDDTKTLKTHNLKKDGLAYRLNSLLKKQNASICMWQNEKFLANNSKFSIPKGDFTVFRIQNVQLKYGCYLLEAKDVDDNSYSIIINILHVNNVNLESNALIKVYKPYECLTVDNCNVIINVFKFECDNIYKVK